jgi:hypothetical protein
MKKKEEHPLTTIGRRITAAKVEALRLAEEVVRLLQEDQPDPFWDDNWVGMAGRWETLESVAAALEICVLLIRQHDPMTIRNLSNQLRHWRRVQGRAERGWLEVRMVGDNGPYIYWRWREPGDRTIHTEYYGRADMAIAELAADAHLLIAYEEQARTAERKDQPPEE